MFVRVASTGQPAFRLRPGERGISVFDRDAADTPLTDDEILAAFREGSTIIERSRDEIEAKGLLVVPMPGADFLPARLQAAHMEIHPSATMTRSQFKAALKELE